MMNPALPQAWDQVAESLDRISLAGERVRYAAAIKPLLALPKSAPILELGCGSGRLLRALAALGYHNLVGSEISQARLRQIAGRGPSVARLVCTSEVPFAAATFDAVVSAAVIEHVVDPPGWLIELTRVTRPGGLVTIATDTYMWHWLEQLGLYHSIQPIDQSIWPGTLIRWAKQAGLQLEGCGGFVNTPDQRWYFFKQLLRLLPRTYRLRRWLNRTSMPSMPSDESEAILEAVRDFPDQVRVDFWACVWSYECYYWFRKS
jgi:ubiquinone/menaquinone biosynthesis C-methylase UbiE